MQISHGNPLELAAAARGTLWLEDACRRLGALPAHPSGRVLIAEEDGLLRAVLGLELHWTCDGRLDRATILMVAVDPEHEHRGIGSRLVRFAEGIARIHGCHRVEVARGLEGWGDGGCWPGLGYRGRGAGLVKELDTAVRRAVGR